MLGSHACRQNFRTRADTAALRAHELDVFLLLYVALPQSGLLCRYVRDFLACLCEHMNFVNN